MRKEKRTKEIALAFMGTVSCMALFAKCQPDTIGVHDSESSCRDEWNDRGQKGTCERNSNGHFIYMPPGGGFYNGNRYNSAQDLHNNNGIVQGKPGGKLNVQPNRPSTRNGFGSTARPSFSTGG